MTIMPLTPPEFSPMFIRTIAIAGVSSVFIFSLARFFQPNFLLVGFFSERPRTSQENCLIGNGRTP